MNTKDYTVSAVQKALRLLTLFEHEDSLTLNSISQLSGLGKSSALRLLYTLHQEGFISFDEESKRYSLGLTVFRLGMRKFENLNFRTVALPHLKRLSDSTGLICYLGVEQDNTLVMLEKVFPKTVPLWAQLMAQPGGTIPLYSTGIGRLLLSRRSDAEVKKYLDTVALERFTPNTIVNRKQLFDLVRQARVEGISHNQGENEPFITSICAPIYDHEGAMIAGMSLCGMTEVMCGDDHQRLKTLLMDAARTISAELGNRESVSRDAAG